MKAIEKMEALTLKVVHAEAVAIVPGLALETVYRWRSALRSGKGVSDQNKRVLVQATAETPHPISWADFAPPELVGVAAGEGRPS